jgi:hypothetical protein
MSVAASSRRIARRLGWAVAIAAAACAQPALASEGGASFYLLGSGGPGAAIMPPLQGVFFNDQFYYYDASARGGVDFEVGGRVVAGLHAQIPADFVTVLWVPTTNLLGGTLALGGALPFGDPMVNVSAVLTGPGGRSISLSASDSALVVGDPVATAAFGWKTGDYSIQFSTLVNIPIGYYRVGQLANLAFHRWAGDESLAFTWHDDKSGWDVSTKTGFTFNGTNTVTHYTTGTEFHAEGSVQKRLSPHWSLGVQSYFFHQVTGDSGSGDRLGPFQGEVTGVGGTAAYDFTIAGKIPATVRLIGLNEFDAINRLQGYSLWLSLTLPLSVKLPPGAH